MPKNKVHIARKPLALPAAKRGKGLSGIEDIDPRITVVKETATVIPWLIKFAIIAGTAYYLYSRYTNKFSAMQEITTYPKANVTTLEAQSRAEAVYGSMGYFTDDLQTALSALSGLNYNGFVRVYNAFGKRTGRLLGGNLDLVAFIHQQYPDDIDKFKFLFNGTFF